MCSPRLRTGTQFTCFTSTEVQILTPEEHLQSSLADKTPRWRQHDSEARATAASKGEARGSDSSDEEEDVAAAHARVDSRAAAGAKDSTSLNKSEEGAAADADALRYSVYLLY